MKARCTFLIILVIHILQGCSPAGYPISEITDSKHLPEFKLSPFDDNFNKAVFKARLTFGKHYLSGLMIFKTVDTGNIRVVFITEIGLKIFDFEFENNDSKKTFFVHYCMKGLDRKIVLKNLGNDIGLLLKQTETQNFKLFIEKEEKHTILKNIQDDKACYYFFDNKNKNLSKIEQSGGFFNRQKVVIYLENYQNGFPNIIRIKQKNIKIEINLYLIEC